MNNYIVYQLYYSYSITKLPLVFNIIYIFYIYNIIYIYYIIYVILCICSNPAPWTKDLILPPVAEQLPIVDTVHLCQAGAHGEDGAEGEPRLQRVLETRNVSVSRGNWGTQGVAKPWENPGKSHENWKLDGFFMNLRAGGGGRKVV